MVFVVLLLITFFDRPTFWSFCFTKLSQFAQVHFQILLKDLLHDACFVPSRGWLQKWCHFDLWLVTLEVLTKAILWLTVFEHSKKVLLLC